MIRHFFVAVLAVALTASAAAGENAAGDALGRITPGQWQVRERGATPPPVMMCVRDAQGLARLRHAGALCRSFVVENTLRRATVHYECPGKGYGQTTLRVESTGVARLDSQGVERGVPFAFTAEARRLGPCPD